METLAALQAREDDASIDAEPGKIVHEVRHGKAARTWFPRYYGTVDATPLFLVLLSNVWRWTNDGAFAQRLKAPALAALEWIDRHGDRDGDGFVEYERRTPVGLLNQSWKDSADSQRFHDGRIATAPIAPCEVQGYVYDAKLRIAEIAREVWRDRDLADRLDAEASTLRQRFNEAYWLPERGSYALALDHEKVKVDSLTSNVGHLLWSGIVPDDRVDRLVDCLLGDALWSGWGVRTMSTSDAGYNPLSYHNGTVWPHDNSLIAAGPRPLRTLERGASPDRAANVRCGAAISAGSLPEVFRRLGPRREDGVPDLRIRQRLRPQAWAAPGASDPDAAAAARAPAWTAGAKRSSRSRRSRSRRGRGR